MWVKSLSELDIKADDHFYPWLTKAYSLGNAMKTLCKDLTVQVISQTIATATIDEQHALNIQENNSWIREVNLLGDGIPWSHGRVIVPQATYAKYKTDFDSLGTKLLGETLLYGKNTVNRSKFEYGLVSQKFWSRRSLFSISGSKLLVIEHFYPEIPALDP
jgi:chorismate--pyruvate lyase